MHSCRQQFNKQLEDQRQTRCLQAQDHTIRITWTPSSWEKAPRDAARRSGLLGLQEENASTDLSSAARAIFGYNKGGGVNLQDRKGISRIRTNITIHLFPSRLLGVHALVPAPSPFLLPTGPPVIHSLVIDHAITVEQQDKRSPQRCVLE